MAVALPAILGDHLVTWTIGLSLVGGILTMLLGRGRTSSRWLGLAFSAPPLALATLAFADILVSPRPGYAFYESLPWIPWLGVEYRLGLDGISVPMFWLTALLTTLSVVFSWDVELLPNRFHGLLLLTQAAVLGVFSALDLFLFYVFWEFTLVPMYFLIAVWGGPNRKYAATKFFLYTFLASLVMLLAFMALYFVLPTGSRSFGLDEITTAAAAMPAGFQKLVFGGLLLGFLVKFPVVPFHTWLPDAHVEAPTAGSVILAGVLLKMGAYGVIRIALPTVPLGARFFVPVMIVIAVLSMYYAAVLCLQQVDYKKLVAYSSIGSMGLVLLGIATLNPIGIMGANFMMFAHGLFSPLLFMLCGVLGHSLGTRDIPKLGGLAARLPRTSWLLVFASMAGVGLPGLAAFVAEFQVFAGTYQAFGLFVVIPVFYLAFSAGYYLWALQRAVFGPVVEHPDVDYHHAYDLHAFEAIAAGAIVALLVVFGAYPRLLTDVLDPAVRGIVALVGGGA
ncbi:MAG TPA: NADH-quinone oxidoreductase subunit M [Candidatus Thermoplasmatota archaeon]|nr:NADH-quinone oxidoreductase subunit M [Candidatus Thermoplasmatota archaeon]